MANIMNKYKSYKIMLELGGFREIAYYNRVNVIVLGILNYKMNKLHIPDHMKYFKYPIPEDYPMPLYKDDYQMFQPVEELLRNAKIDKFLEQEKIRRNIKNVIGSGMRVYTQRCVLIKLMAVDYYNSEWTVYVTKFNNNMCMILKQCDNVVDELPMHWMLFRAHLFSDHPNGTSGFQCCMNGNENYYGLYHADIDDFHLLYTAELGGIDSNEELNDL